MERVFLGIDVGTTNIKLVVARSDMTILYEKSYNYEYDTLPDDWLEIEPQRWLDIILNGMDELQHDYPCQIQAIGVTGQMHTTIFLDKNGHPIRPAILWNDMRTKHLIPEIKRVISEKTNLPQLADIVSNGNPVANIYWLKRYEKEHFNRLHRVMMPVNYVNYFLCEKESLGYCDATTTSLYDLEAHDWARTVFEILGLDINLFPPLKGASEVIGFLREDLQNRWKQKNQVAIVTGTGDNVATALSTGGFETLQPILSLGTSAVLIIPGYYPNLKTIGKNVLAEIRKGDNTMITQGTVQAGAKINSWWVNKILIESDFLGLQQDIPIEKLGHNSVYFIPHLNGEKTLFANPDLRGAFVGLGLDTSQSDMYLAVLEGLAFALRMLMEVMTSMNQVKLVTVVGGGAKSPLWLEIIANVLNKPIRRVTEGTEAVHGAIQLAIMSQGIMFAPPHSNSELILPKTDISHFYDVQFEQYKKAMIAIVSLTSNL